jgi:hypothetical protein
MHEAQTPQGLPQVLQRPQLLALLAVLIPVRPWRARPVFHVVQHPRARCSDASPNFSLIRSVRPAGVNRSKIARIRSEISA